MKIIGLTGKSGAGKGAAAKIMERMGVPHIDCDKVYHSLISEDSPCTRELSEYFGKEILRDNGSIDREKLGSLVFTESNSSKLEALNRITHKHVLKRIREILTEHEISGAKAVTVDAPALFESGFDKECDGIITVTANAETRLKRIMERDSIPEEKALSRINSQKNDAFYTEKADFVIENDSDEAELFEKIKKILREILN